MQTTDNEKQMPDEGRALLTPKERQIISGETEVKDNYKYKVESIVRNRIRKRFWGDVELLREHFPEVYDMIEKSVCEGEPPEVPDGGE